MRMLEVYRVLATPSAMRVIGIFGEYRSFLYGSFTKDT